MTLDDIRALVVSVDPSAAHYDSARRTSENYTVWREYQRTGLSADNRRANKSWRFQVDRFTKFEVDAIANALETVLDAHPAIAYDYQVDYEPETGFIHHIFDCEAAGA